MDEDEIILEDGELSNDSVNNYTPLERPDSYSATQSVPRFPVVDETESEEQQSSDSGSDSDNKVPRHKKPKIQLKPKVRSTKQKKYDIWSTRVQEDVLAETLNSCDVTKKDRSRDVETYDYTMGSRFYKSEGRKTFKRTREDRKNVHLRIGKRADSDDKAKGSARNILELAVNLENDVEVVAKDIANKLFEEKEELILKIINIVGKEKCIETFNLTKEIEEEGGMLIMNQARRRTPGGVFFFLIRSDEQISQEDKDLIFDEDRRRYKILLKEKQKMKNKQLKMKTAAERAKLLPKLVTRAELLTASINDKDDERNVVNPPPSPESDDHENTGDGMDKIGPMALLNGAESFEKCREKLQTYDDDFLDINCTNNDMDLF